MALIGLGLLTTPTATLAAGALIAHELRPRQVVGRTTTIRLVNDGDGAIRLSDPWIIEDRSSGQQLSEFWFSEDEALLEPGEEVLWEWNQDTACYGACVNVREGDPVGPGAYQVSVTRADGTFTFSRSFRIGRYFTLGFDSRPRARFVVYVAEPNEVSQMEAEVQAEDKTLIVSGIVRGSKRYNSDWNFTMGPRSIELGEVFVEVCDGSPYYVQRHRKKWLGERWCPWSSYVEKVGR